MSSDSEPDLEISTHAIKRPKKMPTSPSEEFLEKEPRKMSTKEMIRAALGESKGRKGTSLHAIKKYMTERHNVDTERLKYLIKKYIKRGVEDGTIVQVKGIGASGSFRLAPAKKQAKPAKKKAEKKPEQHENSKETKKIEKKTTESKGKSKLDKSDASKKPDHKLKKAKSTEEVGLKEKEQKKTKNSKVTKAAKEIKEGRVAKGVKKPRDGTPAKKGSKMVKRKSIGSIIKPPKMKPKKRD